MTAQNTLSRRRLIGGTAATLASVRAAFPYGAHAQGAGPETTKARLGYIPLTDAAPLIIAKEQSLFAKYGMPDVEVLMQPSWPATRDNLIKGGEAGGTDGAHILTPMPYMMSAGKAGANIPAFPMLILARISTNGQAISMSNAMKPIGTKLDAKVAAAALKGKKSKVAMTFRGGTHDLWMRYWLAAAGINPDTDVELIAVPPPKMVEQMREGAMDAFCVGEPWGDQLIYQELGYTACITGEIWKDHPEKSFAMSAAWVEKHPRAAEALTAAIIEAQMWCDKMDNKSAMSVFMGKRGWMKVPPSEILPRAEGHIDYGDGREVKNSPLLMKYFADHASYPYQSHDLWFITEDIRWGVLPPDVDSKALIAAVNREDVWRAAAAKAGVAAADMPKSKSRGKETFFDGHVFDPENPAEWLKGQPIKKMMG